jgi:peptidyl-prolyl cis-trans isomerase SurA
MRTRIALLAALLAAVPAAAQTAPTPQPGEELWDGVLAVVGDTILLRSDLQLALEQLRASGTPVPEDPEGLQRVIQQILDERINDLLLLEAARADGTAVSDAEVQAAVADQERQVRQRFPSEAAFQEALGQSGRTIEAYRTELAAQFRDQTVTQRYVRKRMGQMAPVAVSEAEISAFFAANRERFGVRPASITYQQVIVRPMPSDSARQAALETIQRVQRELTEGADFEVLARRYSQDGTKERGGDLGWFRQGQMVRNFDLAVFGMRPGQTSGIIETEFGFHIIKLEKVRSGERQARHILIQPVITPADVERARQRADSVATALRGGANPADLAARYETPDVARFQRDVPLDRLQPAVALAVTGVEAGGVAGPVQIDGGPNPQFSVMRVSERTTQGEYTLDEQRERVRNILQEQRQMQRLLADLRRETYVSIQL